MQLTSFSSGEPDGSAGESPVSNPNKTDSEHAALLSALYSLLETLPQSYSGRENIRLLCDAILNASPQLKFIWVGFCNGNTDNIQPYAAVGNCTDECASWHLPSNCFDAVGPSSQAVPAHLPAPSLNSGLFTPWSNNLDGCSVKSALSIPLRSEKRTLRGLIVFYASSKHYFARIDVALFQAFCHVAEIIWKRSSMMHLLTQKAQQDPLTGLMNRRHTVQTLEKHMASAKQSGMPLSILMCQIKDFSKLNDVYGWLASDTILAAFANEISLQLRPQDKGGRWTGTEFLFILPQTGNNEALALAKSLNEYFLIHPVTVKNWSIRLALTVGVATYSKQIIGVDDFILCANQSMVNSFDELPS